MNAQTIRLSPWPKRTDAGLSCAIMAGSIGTVVEHYDLLVYGIAAAFVCNTLYLSKLDPAVETLASFGLVAIGFFARSLGSVLVGYFDNSVRRKIALLAYDRTGIQTSVRLAALHLIQDTGLGGKSHNVSILVVERAPGARRDLYGSLVDVGFPLGLAGAPSDFTVAGLRPESALGVWASVHRSLSARHFCLTAYSCTLASPRQLSSSARGDRGEVARSPLGKVTREQS